MTAFVAHWGYIGLFVAIFAEEAGVPLPVPGDVFIAALGAAGRTHHASFPMAALVVLVASTGGSAVLFHASRHYGHPMLLRVGRRFGFDADRADRVERWLARRGAAAVIIGRLTPGLRIVLTVAAGALHMRRKTFLAGTAVASLIWVTIYYWLGFLLGAGIATALRHFLGRAIADPDAAAFLITIGVLAAGTAAGILLWRHKRARRRRSRVPGAASDPPAVEEDLQR